MASSSAVSGSVQISFADMLAHAVLNWADMLRFSLIFGFLLGVIDEAGALLSGADWIRVGFSLILLSSIATVGGLVAGLLTPVVIFGFMKSGQKAVEWTIDEQGVKCADGSGNIIFTPWNQMKSFQKRKLGWFFRRKPIGHMTIPLRTFTAEQERLISALVPPPTSTN